MTIRPATSPDTPRLVELALRFLAESPYGVLLGRSGQTPAHVSDLVGVLLAWGVVFVAEVDGQIEGLIALAALPHPVTGHRFADEVAWWVEPEVRGGTIGPRLLAAAETWARAEGCVLLKMIAPHDAPDVGRFLARRGYAPVETAWAKHLPISQ